MDLRITSLDGYDSIDLSDIDVVVRDFNVGSIPVNSMYGEVEGRSGTIDYGADYGQRTISVPFYFKSRDSGDYPLLRDELFGLVVGLKPFFISELRRKNLGELSICDEDVVDEDVLVGGKRYKVRLADGFDVEQVFAYGFGELVFETVELPFAESIGTSMDIDRDGISNNPEIWGYGMGLNAGDDDSLIYDNWSGGVSEGISSSFIYNPGNVDVVPFEQELKITVLGVNGSSPTGLTITNAHNGSYIKYKKNAKDFIGTIIDGIDVTKSGVQTIRDTDRTFISLSPGWNKIEISNGIRLKMQFDFRFYYK